MSDGITSLISSITGAEEERQKNLRDVQKTVLAAMLSSGEFDVLPGTEAGGVEFSSLPGVSLSRIAPEDTSLEDSLTQAQTGAHEALEGKRLRETELLGQGNQLQTDKMLVDILTTLGTAKIKKKGLLGVREERLFKDVGIGKEKTPITLDDIATGLTSILTRQGGQQGAPTAPTTPTPPNVTESVVTETVSREGPTTAEVSEAQEFVTIVEALGPLQREKFLEDPRRREAYQEALQLSGQVQ
jgi:hypothetical protein